MNLAITTLLEYSITFLVVALSTLSLFAIYYVYKLTTKIGAGNQTRRDTASALVDYQRPNVHKASLFDVVIDQILCQIQLDLNATKVVLARFHNGVAFANGFHMLKFSITHETPGGSKEPLMDKCQGILNSKYAASMLQLSTCNYLCISDPRDWTKDRAFTKDMEYYGFQSTNLFLIRQLGDNFEEGFIGVNFRDTHVMNSEERDKVLLKIPRILNLVNQIQISLKD